MEYDNGQAVYSGTDVAAGFPFLRVLYRQLRSFFQTQKHPQNTSDFFNVLLTTHPSYNLANKANLVHNFS